MSSNAHHLNDALSDVEQILQELEMAKISKPDEVSDLIDEANSSLNDAKRYLALLPTSEQQPFRTRIIDAQRKIDGAKSQALGLGPTNYGATTVRSDNQKAQDRHQQDMERLRRAHDQLLQTEQTSLETIEHLDRQEEQMRRINDNMKQTQGELHTSNKLLASMSRWHRP